MAELFKFDPNSRSPICLAFEEMLPDFLDQAALDQALSPADQTWFDRHTATCADCSAMLADAQRGAAWLELLKSPRPEPSAQLFERILAQTSGAEELNPLPIPQLVPHSSPHYGDEWVQPASRPAKTIGNLLRFPAWLPSHNHHFQPRLAMTAAMAFFSVALTLNLAGVRLDQLHARDLNPNRVKQTYYEASAEAVRYYDNLRVVRDVESRVDDLRDANPTSTSAPESAPATQPEQAQPDQKQQDKDPKGSSRIETPLARPQFQPVDDKQTPTPTKSLNKGGLV